MCVRPRPPPPARADGDQDGDGCSCLLACVCARGPVYQASLSCSCTPTTETGAFVWLDVAVSHSVAGINYSLSSPTSLPAVAVSGSAVNGSTRQHTAVTVSNNPFRAVYPVAFLTGPHTVTASFSYSNALLPEDAGSTVATVSAGLAPCTVFNLRVLTKVQAAPQDSYAELSWTALPPLTAPYTLVHVLVQVNCCCCMWCV